MPGAARVDDRHRSKPARTTLIPACTLRPANECNRACTAEGQPRAGHILRKSYDGAPGNRRYRCIECNERDEAEPTARESRDALDDKVNALECGADEYLVKPFSFVVLFARLRALVRRGAPERFGREA